MREQRQPPRERQAAREGVILFRVGAFNFAIAAGAVKEIRGLEGLNPFNLGGIAAHLEKMKFTLERGGTTYFVVDAAGHFDLKVSTPGRVLILRNSAAALLVDSTDRMMEISALHALPRAFTHDEREWYRGLAVIDGEVVPVVNPGAFLNEEEQEVLRSGLERLRGAATA